MDVSTRPSHRRRQDCAQYLRRLAALSFSAALCLAPLPLHAATIADDQSSPELVSSIAQDASHEVAIRTVEAGQETISLAARLSTVTNALAEDVEWEVRSQNGELVVKDRQTELNSKLRPGAYVIEARYGAVSIRETLNLPQGHSLAVNFVLNAGGLRILPKLKDVADPGLNSHCLIYALSGPAKGKLITHSKLPGEVLKLAAGQYRIESRLGDGNAIVVADVRVKPGRMSAIEVRHIAGLARLSYVGASSAKVVWDIKHEGGEKITSKTGLSYAIALQPGIYLAEAHVNGEMLSARFKISAGEERDILLGN
jgi:hypothetical protein